MNPKLGPTTGPLNLSSHPEISLSADVEPGAITNRIKRVRSTKKRSSAAYRARRGKYSADRAQLASVEECKQTCFALPPTTNSLISRIARLGNMSRSQVVRAAIRELAELVLPREVAL